jgi:hypothetical protein
MTVTIHLFAQLKRRATAAREEIQRLRHHAHRELPIPVRLRGGVNHRYIGRLRKAPERAVNERDLLARWLRSRKACINNVCAHKRYKHSELFRDEFEH